MRIAIDAPPVRSLSANEKMVYQFLKDGLTPLEIAKRMHISIGKGNFFDNRHDVPNENVMGLITSIREKGWDIPTDNNKEEEEMARLTEEQKREIVQLSMTKAMTHKDIAAKYGISKSTVWYIVDQYKKSGECAFVTDEELERSYGDGADAPCYEVTGDTDIEAYMADRTEKEPATAATETGSEQEICNDIPADIITETKENVKSLHSFSTLAADAVWRKVNDLREEAIELQDRELALESLISDYKGELRRVDEQLMYVEAEIDSLLEDYDALVGGAAI